MMSYRQNTIVIDDDLRAGDLNAAWSFISLMEDNKVGITREMNYIREKGLPLRLLQVRSLTLNLDAESVLKSGVTDLLLTSYWLDILISGHILDGLEGPLNSRLENMGDVLPLGESFVLDYKRAVEDLSFRFITLERRGWMVGLYSTQFNEGVLSSGIALDTSNIVPLSSTQLFCRHLF